MITRQDIEKLASLARIQITDEEKDQFRQEIDSILAYVAQIQAAVVSLDLNPEAGVVKNIMREDVAHESGAYTEIILKEAPSRQGEYLKVKKILS